MHEPDTVSRDEWLKARKALLAKEKAHLAAQDALAAERRALPRVKVEKPYVFEGPNGPETLSDLFAGRSQLIVKHFMLGPDWEEGCVGCSFGADAEIDGSVIHLVNHDVMLVAVSRAPYAKIAAFHKRMGWRFKWVSSAGSDFNFDYHVSFTDADRECGKAYYNYDMREYMSDELPGLSVFCKNAAGEIFHTYSTYARGADQIGSAYSLLDLTPKGRNESPGGNLSEWVRHHDKYGDDAAAPGCHD